MGHSWGSFLGIKTIESYPEDYWAFIGIGQVTNQLESEKLAFDYMLQHAMEINDSSAVRRLNMIDSNSTDFPQIDYIMSTRNQLMNRYGIGLMRKNFSTFNLVMSFVFFKGYTLSEKINYLRGTMLSIEYLWDYVVESNLFETSTVFQVPIFITHGKYDYQVSYELAQDFFEIIETPMKEFFTFENSAHSPNLEEREKFIQILRSIALEVMFSNEN